MPVNVVHSYPTWLPATHTWMFSQVRQLQCSGIEAHVVCRRTRNLDQFRVNNIHSLDDLSQLKKFWDKLLPLIGVRGHLGYLVEASREVGANILHSHFGYEGWANLGAARKLGIKHVVTFYGKDVNKLPKQNPVWLKRYQRLFSEADRFFCEGSFMASALEALGCPARKISVMHLGIDAEHVPFQVRRLQSEEAVKVLISASFREKKGIVDAIQAVKIFSEERAVELTIIGDAGSERDSQIEKQKIISALETTGLRSKTRLLGYMSYAAMIEESLKHHIFLSPSKTAADGDTEGGAPVTIIEMLATGIPVVSTMHCDIPEVMGPVLRGSLVPEGDCAGLARQLLAVADSSETWHKTAHMGRRWIELEYDVKKQAQRMTAEYLDLIGA